MLLVGVAVMVCPGVFVDVAVVVPVRDKEIVLLGDGVPDVVWVTLAVGEGEAPADIVAVAVLAWEDESERVGVVEAVRVGDAVEVTDGLLLVVLGAVTGPVWEFEGVAVPVPELL